MIDFGFPTHGAGLGVERNQHAVGRGKEDHVLVDAKVFVACRLRIDALGVIALIFPDQVAVDAVDRLHRGAGHKHVKDAAVHDGRGLLSAGRQTTRPGYSELADIVLSDLAERTKAMLVVGAVDHQPVGRIGIAQHGVGDRRKRWQLGEQRWDTWSCREDCEDDGSNFVANLEHRRLFSAALAAAFAVYGENFVDRLFIDRSYSAECAGKSMEIFG